MRIKEIIQIENGTQKRPYADHIYKWKICLDYFGGKPSREEMLSFCQDYLKKAARTKDEYQKEMQRTDISFNDKMMVVCGHWYSLEQKDDFEWIYLVHEEYID